MDCYQRGRTRRIDRHTGPLKPEHVRKSTGRDAKSIASTKIGINHFWMCEQCTSVIVVGDSKIDADISTAQRARRTARIFYGFPTNLQNKSLLRVHARGFTWRNSEELCVKLVDIGKKSAVTCRHLARLIGILGIECIQRPPLRRNLTDSVAPSP